MVMEIYGYDNIALYNVILQSLSHSTSAIQIGKMPRHLLCSYKVGSVMLIKDFGMTMYYNLCQKAILSPPA